MSSIGKGFHFHVGGVAVMDVMATIVGAWGIAYYMKWPIPLTIFGMFVLGILAHRVLHIRTTLDKLLFPQEK